MIVIVGGGIIGLSLASELSATNDVTLIENHQPYAGSLAAAANISTKGQLYGRDPHFALKIEAKSIYKQWLSRFFSPEDFACYFSVQNLIEWFETPEDCAKQMKRVLQPLSELESRGLPPNPVQRASETSILYQDELWVDARVLCQRIRTYCTNVNFVTGTVESVDSLLRQFPTARKIVLACGAWTPLLIRNSGIAFPVHNRLTFGSVAHSLSPHVGPFRESNKLVTSGGQTGSFYTGTTLRCSRMVEEPDCMPQWPALNEKLLKEASLSDQSLFIRSLKGWRIGFGHSEIKIESLGHIESTDLFICAGAHRSGYAFAPLVGRELQKLPQWKH